MMVLRVNQVQLQAMTGLLSARQASELVEVELECQLQDPLEVAAQVLLRHHHRVVVVKGQAELGGQRQLREGAAPPDDQL